MQQPPCPRRSTAYHFNPKPASPRFLSHSLVELLNQISPTFKKNFAVLQKKRWCLCSISAPCLPPHERVG